MLSDRRRQPPARDPRDQRGLHRYASVRHVRCPRGAWREGACHPSERRADHRISGFPSVARQCAAARHNLEAGEIITAIELPPQGFVANYTYLKLRERLSYAFALVSVAVGMELEGGTIRDARFALGGVAHKPWRDEAAEAVLRGEEAVEPTFRHAADVVLRDAIGLAHNTFKIELARRAIVRALTQAARGTPQSQSDKRIR
jgi:CO/xanthine dehydrogenase FAD-binding subunit